ncbi:MAG: fused MFS/spermidine synthase [Deltaproteobacteria bacterium]|nr:fused MFS/spermidine synthase [Deltaproteobacteria bacterium]
MNGRSRPWVLAACYLLSGAAALALEVLWARSVSRVMGAGALGVATTLSAFMAGLALGAELGGRYAHRLRRPVVAFAVLELLIASSALVVPALLSHLPVGGFGLTTHAVLRFGTTFAILLVPTAAMGATLPILTSTLDADQRRAGWVGRLYAINTLGAVGGCALAGFWLIPTFGVRGSMFVASATDLLVALVALASVRGPARGAIAQPEVTSRDSSLRRFGRPVLLVCFGLSGACALALELLLTRSLSVVIGSSTYAFTSILSTFLAGLALGAAASAWLSPRVERPAAVSAIIFALASSLVLAGTRNLDEMPALVEALLRNTPSPQRALASEVLMVAGVVIPLSAAFGAIMPLVLRALPSRPEVVGRALLFNTFGGILGSFVAGFIVLPVVGVERGFKVVAVLLLVAALLALVAARRPRIVLAALASAPALVLLVRGDRWDLSRWTSGAFRPGASLRADANRPVLLFHRDGIISTVTVERVGDLTRLKIDGKVDASDLADVDTQAFTGSTALLFHPDPRDVFVVGYGSGMTAAAVLSLPTVNRVHVVEIERAVLDADRFFTHVNGGVLRDPRLSLGIDDARAALIRTHARFDVIASHPSNPWMSGASALYTREYFELGRSRLREGGIFMSFLPLYELSAENVHRLLRTFASVFPRHAVLLVGSFSTDAVLVGATSALELPLDRVAERLRNPRIRADLARAGVSTPEDLLGLVVSLNGTYGDGALNTDDHPIVEFTAPFELQNYARAEPELPFILGLEGRRLEMLSALFPGFGLEPSSDPARPDRLAKAARRMLAQGHAQDAQKLAEAALAVGTSSTAANVIEVLRRFREPDVEPVLVSKSALSDPLYDHAADFLLKGNAEMALKIADRLEGFPTRSLVHGYLYAVMLLRANRGGEARTWLEEILRLAPDFADRVPGVTYYAARAALTQDDFGSAVRHMERYLEIKSRAPPAAPQ